MDKPKRLKEQLDEFDAANKKVKFTFGTLVVTGWCVFLIIIATFTQIDFSHYMPGTLDPMKGSLLTIKHYSYIPQIPVILFIAALIGKRFGIASVVIYILLGLTVFPIFALGGGITYLFQYSFGYIIAYIPAIFVTAFILQNQFTYGRIAKATFFGVLTIHIIGIFYLILMAIIYKDPFSNVLGWISMQSGIKIIYDYIFGFLAILFAKPVRYILWVSMA